jgi:hypothetical protein
MTGCSRMAARLTAKGAATLAEVREAHRSTRVEFPELPVIVPRTPASQGHWHTHGTQEHRPGQEGAAGAIVTGKAESTDAE